MIMLKSIIGKYILTSYQYGYLINNDFPKKQIISFINDILNNPSIMYNSIYAKMVIHNPIYNPLNNDFILKNVYLNKIADSWVDSWNERGSKKIWANIINVHSFDIPGASAIPHYHDLYKKTMMFL